MLADNVIGPSTPVYGPVHRVRVGPVSGRSKRFVQCLISPVGYIVEKTTTHPTVDTGPLKDVQMIIGREVSLHRVVVFGRRSSVRYPEGEDPKAVDTSEGGGLVSYPRQNVRQRTRVDGRCLPSRPPQPI